MKKKILVIGEEWAQKFDTFFHNPSWIGYDMNTYLEWIRDNVISPLNDELHETYNNKHQLKMDFDKLICDKRCLQLDVKALTEIAFERHNEIIKLEKQIGESFLKFNNGWVNVNDELPPIKEHGFSEHVLVHTNTSLIQIGFLNYNRTENTYTWEQATSPKSFEQLGYKITHWMILPEIPLR